MGRPIRPFDEMAKRKEKWIATVTRKLGILINCRVQKPVLKDLDANPKSLKIFTPRRLEKARHRTTGRTEGASRKTMGRRRRTNVPGGQWS